VSARYCGREFADQELALVGALCGTYPTRAQIARALCGALGWVDQRGQPKAMSARVALARMERDGLVTLPPPQHANNHNSSWPLRLPAGEHPEAVTDELSALLPLRLSPVTTKAASKEWNELVARYHYLGYSPLPGAQRRYLVESQAGVLAVLGVSAAAWSCRPRDEFIGWDQETRKARLHLVVNNARFLVLPWVRVANLASASLGLLARVVPRDFEAAYGYAPVLLETFVESGRFLGTSYRAANFVHLGQTKGRGKLDRRHEKALPVKDVYVLPLCRAFRRRLGASA